MAGRTRGAQAADSALADASLMRLRAPLEDAAAVLRAMQTVFLSSDDMDQPEFEQYSENLRIPDAQPGYVATVFARRQAHPEDPRRVAYPYVLAAPLRGNESLIGFDIAAQKPNLLALQRARDADKPILSAPFPLRQFKEYSGTGRTGRDRAPAGVFARSHPHRRGRTKAPRNRRAGDQPAPATAGVRSPGRATSWSVSRCASATSTAPADEHFFASDAAFVSDAPVHTRTLEFGGHRWEMQLRPRVPAAGHHARAQCHGRRHHHQRAAGGAAVVAVHHASPRGQAGPAMSERFRESEARFRTLNELLPALVLLAEASEGRIVYANQAARLRLGEAKGMLLAEVLADPALRERASAASGREDWPSLDAALLGRDGVPFWVNASIAHVDMDGVPHRLMVATDISEHRELTERLIHQATPRRPDRTVQPPRIRAPPGTAPWPIASCIPMRVRAHCCTSTWTSSS